MTRMLVLLTVMMAFGALSAVALMDAGYWGIIAAHLRSWGGAQVLTDLVILGVLACVWMARDAAQRRTRVWPFIVLTLVGGSFGPLLYLVTREMAARKR